MSTTYYLRLKDDNNLDVTRKFLKDTESMINSMLEKIADKLNDMVTKDTKIVLNKDNFNKQFCNAASWYGSYPDEPEEYHLKRICLESVEHIQVEIGTYYSGSFHWKLMSIPDGYYDVENLGTDCPYNEWRELRDFEFPRDKAQLKLFMKKYKDKVEIVDEYDEKYTLTAFLKKVDEYK